MVVDLKKIDYTSKDIELEDKRWLTPIELEEYTGWSRSWQSKARMNSSRVKLPYKKLSKFVLYDRLEIDAFIEEHTVVER